MERIADGHWSVPIVCPFVFCLGGDGLLLLGAHLTAQASNLQQVLSEILCCCLCVLCLLPSSLEADQATKVLPLPHL